MKKIVLKQFAKAGKTYSVSLGNGTIHTFHSKRALQNFLNQTNKFLSKKLFEVHSIYMMLWTEYQRCWFYFGYGKEKGSWSLHTTEENKCKEVLSSCESSLAFAADISDRTNGNHLSFKNIHVAISYLKDAVKILRPLHKKRSITADVYRLDFIFQQLLHSENHLNSYGQLESTGHISYTSFDKIKIAK